MHSKIETEGILGLREYGKGLRIQPLSQCGIKFLTVLCKLSEPNAQLSAQQLHNCAALVLAFDQTNVEGVNFGTVANSPGSPARQTHFA